MIVAIGKTLEPFDDDNIIPVFGFGDARTTDISFFALHSGEGCQGFQEVIEMYVYVSSIIECIQFTQRNV